MPVTILVIPATLPSLLLALALKLTLSFTPLELLLSAILILIPPGILCLGRGAGHYANADKQQQSQDCASKFFHAVQFHGLLTSAAEVRNDHASVRILITIRGTGESAASHIPYGVNLNDIGN